MLARKWAWQALLASDDTEPDTVVQIEAALDGLTERQPALQARVKLYWLRQVTYGTQPLGARLVDDLTDLAVLVSDHNAGRAAFDDYVVAGALNPDPGLALRVRKEHKPGDTQHVQLGPNGVLSAGAAWPRGTRLAALKNGSCDRHTSNI